MTDLKAVYQRVFIEHSRAPHNSGLVEAATHQATKHNPLCGDRVEVTLEVVEDRVRQLCCLVRGCALCTAASSMMTLELKGATVSESLALCSQVTQTLQTAWEQAESADAMDSTLPPLPPSLRAFLAVRQVPSRIGCLTLSFQALREALQGAAG